MITVEIGAPPPHAHRRRQAPRGGGAPVSFDDMLASVRVSGRLVRLRRPSAADIERLNITGDMRATSRDRALAAAALAELTGLAISEVKEMPTSAGLTLLGALECYVATLGVQNDSTL